MNKIEKAIREIFKDFEEDKTYPDNKTWCGCHDGDMLDLYDNTKENFIELVIDKLKSIEEKSPTREGVIKEMDKDYPNKNGGEK